jgi:tetratricopeptide (TPR) repeat protein
MALGDAYLQSGDPEQAIKALELGVQSAPEQVEPRLALSRAYIASSDLEAAARCAEEAVSIAPNQIVPLLLRAEIAIRSGDARIARNRAEAALQHNPDDPGALHLLSRALSQLGHQDDAGMIGNTEGSQAALDALRELSMRYPDEPRVLAPLATALATVGENDEAIRAAQHALHGKPTGLEPEEGSRLHYLLGNLLRKTGQLDAAIHHLSEATRLNPGQIEAYLDLGGTQQERRQHTLALQTYQRAIQVAPRDPRPYHQAGLALKASHDYPEAEKMLRRAADLAPEDLSIHRQLGAIVALNLVYNHRTVSLDA